MTYEEVVENALSRTLEFDGEFPSTRLPMYRRIGQRQQQLYTAASKINPDYYGQRAGAALDSEFRLDLRDLDGATNLDQAVGVQRVEIQDAGTSSYTTGDEVNIVSVDDVEADIAPRVSIRDQIIKGIGVDLTNVVSLCVYYPRIPDMPLTAEDGTTDIDLQEAYQELLIIDLTMYLVRKSLSLNTEVKAGILGALKEEEGGALTQYLSDVATYHIGQHHRFSEPVSTATR